MSPPKFSYDLPPDLPSSVVREDHIITMENKA